MGRRSTGFNELTEGLAMTVHRRQVHHSKGLGFALRLQSGA